MTSRAVARYGWKTCLTGEKIFKFGVTEFRYDLHYYGNLGMVGRT